MSAGDRDTLVSLMVKHQRCEIRFDIAGAFFPDCDMRLDRNEYASISQARRAHLADVLLSSDWLREQPAEAWDDGYGTCLGDFDIAARREARSPNPYRTTEDTDAH